LKELLKQANYGLERRNEEEVFSTIKENDMSLNRIEGNMLTIILLLILAAQATVFLYISNLWTRLENNEKELKKAIGNLKR